MDERTRVRNDLDSLANEGHFIHDFVQFAEPTLQHAFGRHLPDVTIRFSSALDRATARLGAFAPAILSHGVSLHVEVDDRFPELAPPPIMVIDGTDRASTPDALAAIRESFDLLAAVAQRSYPEISIGIIVTADTRPPFAIPEIAWLPQPELMCRLDRTVLLMQESINAWIGQVADVEHIKERSASFGFHFSTWEVLGVRTLGIASLEYELLKRLALLDTLESSERALAAARRDRMWAVLATLEPCLAHFLNSLPVMPLLKDFVCTSYPSWDRASYYERAFDKWGKGAVRIHPLTPKGDLLPHECGDAS